MQENLEDNFEIKNTLGISLVGITSVRLTSVQENRGGRTDTARPAVDALRSIFWSEISYKKNIRKISKQLSWENIEQSQKGFQNNVEIDSQSNHKSMPKQVSTNIMKILKIHVFLMCKNM